MPSYRQGNATPDTNVMSFIDFSIPEFLTQERSLFVFFLATVFLGGSAATMTGRAIAMAWRPWWHVVFAMVVLGLAVRFIHFAVFRSTLLTLHYYLVDTAACLLFGLASFRITRVGQMVNGYRWINGRAGPLSWRRIAPGAAGTSERP
jgi:hypothetical protein